MQMLPYNRSMKRSGRYQTPDTTGTVSVVILRSGDDFVGLQVDEVMGEQEIVIKQLTGPVPKPLGISGVTVQGDGRVMVIADVLELVDLSLDRVERSSGPRDKVVHLRAAKWRAAIEAAPVLELAKAVEDRTERDALRAEQELLELHVLDEVRIHARDVGCPAAL